jgi:hypothetical protein
MAQHFFEKIDYIKCHENSSRVSVVNINLIKSELLYFWYPQCGSHTSCSECHVPLVFSFTVAAYYVCSGGCSYDKKSLRIRFWPSVTSTSGFSDVSHNECDTYL